MPALWKTSCFIIPLMSALLLAACGEDGELALEKEEKMAERIDEEGLSKDKSEPVECGVENECCEGGFSVNDGGSCNDGNGCTGDGTCEAGLCVQGEPVDCTQFDTDCIRHSCTELDEDNYECTPEYDTRMGMQCDRDGDGCTKDICCNFISDSCAPGECVEGVTVDCEAEAYDLCLTFPDECPANLFACNEFECISLTNYTHECVNVPVDGAACDDLDACTGDGVCLGGDCTEGEPVDCSRVSDDCNVGVCVDIGDDMYDCEKDPMPKNGEACNADDDGCTVDDLCVEGVCTAGAHPDCSELDYQCGQGVCSSVNENEFECEVDWLAFELTSCDDGDDRTVNDQCISGECVGQACTCDEVSDCCDGCLPINNGASCNADNDGCTSGDSCQSGACREGNPVRCNEVADQCNVGVCVSTGAQSYECTRDAQANNGKPCNGDDDGCTSGDTCQEGVCIVGEPVDCSDLTDQCNVGVCESAGVGSYRCVADGSEKEGEACDDQNPDTGGDRCRGGQCVGDECDCAVVSDCCDGCLALREGLLCNGDDDGCTVDDRCASGVCVLGREPDCSDLTDQCNYGKCESTGTNSYRCVGDSRYFEGYLCDDENPETGPDYCVEGRCVGEGCTCSGETFCCDGCQPQNENNPCNADDNGCTQGDRCAMGFCVAGEAADCSALNDVCNEGVCISTGNATYRCEKENEAFEGFDCDDASLCTADDTCIEGECTGAMKDCTALDSACLEGVCDGETGECVEEARADESSCDDEDPCTENDVCASGLCAGAPIECDDAIDCTDDACDSSAGGCVFTPDDALCTGGDECNTPHCDEAEGCILTPVENWTACTIEATGEAGFCVNGECVAGVSYDRIDSASLMPETGEVEGDFSLCNPFLPVTAPCVASEVLAPDAFFRWPIQAGFFRFELEIPERVNAAIAIWVSEAGVLECLHFADDGTYGAKESIEANFGQTKLATGELLIQALGLDFNPNDPTPFTVRVVEVEEAVADGDEDSGDMAEEDALPVEDGDMMEEETDSADDGELEQSAEDGDTNEQADTPSGQEEPSDKTSSAGGSGGCRQGGAESAPLSWMALLLFALLLMGRSRQGCITKIPRFIRNGNTKIRLAPSGGEAVEHED